MDEENFMKNPENGCFDQGRVAGNPGKPVSNWGDQLGGVNVL